MPERFNKYCWDDRNFSNWSNLCAFKRIAEYSGFSDLIHFPFQYVKKNIYLLNIDKLWTDEIRKRFLKAILPFVKESDTWDELFEKFIHRPVKLS